MIKGKDLLGRNIVAINTGERIDSVRDLVFDHQANQVLGLLVDEGGWFRSARVVPFQAIRSIGEDAIMVDSADAVTTTREDGRLAEVLDSDISLIGMTLLTTDGQNLGKIADVYFEETSGRVEGYDATGGIFSDLTSGRSFVPAPEDVQIGQDAAIVPISVATAMQEQEPGGLKGAYQSAAESVKHGYENIAEATKERQKEYVVGKTAGGDITLEDGSVIVRKGDTITAEQADQAEGAGKLAALATAATGGVLSEAYGSAKERVQGSVEELKGASAERQKDYVIGKTAGTDVTAEVADGVQEVIVHQGTVITPFHAERAEQAGRLPALVAAAGGGSLSETVQTLTGRSEPTSVEETIGRRVRSDVRTPTGNLLAVQGQIVTPAVAERARTLGLEAGLIAATVAPQTGGSGSGTAAALSGGVASVSEGATNLLDRAKSWFSDKREEAGEALENRQEQQLEQKVRDALGRPVTRVILAPDDTIILNVGEIVTHKAIDAARAGDVLDILVGSVSKEEPVIDPLAVRPHETGVAALEGQADLAEAGRLDNGAQTQAGMPPVDPTDPNRRG